MEAPAHRLILNEEYGEAIETIMEGQSRVETARRMAVDADVVEHLDHALGEFRSAQRMLSQARFTPAWDGTTERRRCLKAQNGAYDKRQEARA